MPHAVLLTIMQVGWARNALNEASADIRQGSKIAEALWKNQLTTGSTSSKSVLQRWLSLPLPVIKIFPSEFQIKVSELSNRELLEFGEKIFTDRILDDEREHGCTSQTDVLQKALLFRNEYLLSNEFSEEIWDRLKQCNFERYWVCEFLERNKEILKSTVSHKIDHLRNIDFKSSTMGKCFAQLSLIYSKYGIHDDKQVYNLYQTGFFCLRETLCIPKKAFYYGKKPTYWFFKLRFLIYKQDLWLNLH